MFLMSNANSAISVLIRSANRPELVEALRSLQLQTLAAAEVVVLDVTARGDWVLPDVPGINSRLVVPSAPLSRAAACNRLLDECRGEFTLFLDDDDWLAPNHLSNLHEALTARPEAFAAHSEVSCVRWNADTGRFDEVRRYKQSTNAVRVYFENVLPIHAVLFRMQPLREAGAPRFDPQFDLYEDWDFWIQCAQLGEFVLVPRLSAYYRIHHQYGMGVRLQNPEEGTTALHRIVQKWWSGLSLDKQTEFVGLGRQAYALMAELAERDLSLHEAQAFIGKLEPELQRITQEFDRLSQANAHTEITLRKTQADYASLEALKNAVDEALVETQTLLNGVQAQLVQSQAESEAERANGQALQSQLDASQQQLGEHQALLAHITSGRAYRLSRVLSEAYGQLRAAVGPLKVKTARTLLAGLTRVYHSNALAPVVRLVSPELKRWVRTALMRHTQVPREQVQPALVEELGPTKVSIVVPVYNHARYIEKCIDSAAAQTWPNLEVIVVNDASPDPEVKRILAKYDGHARVKVIHHAQNMGICEAQNTALVASCGRIVAFLDCDDYMREDAIALCMESWKPDTVYLHSGRINVDENDQEINRIHFLSLPREDYFAENLNAMYATHLKMIRRDAFAKVGLFDSRFNSAQDYDMLMRIAFHYPSSSFVHVPDFVYFHRLHAQQTTEKQRSNQDNYTVVIQNEARMREAIRAGRFDKFISIIMLSYGKERQTLKALQGLKATVKVPHEIILYDNGSQPHTVDFIKTEIEGRFDGLKVFYGDKNLGPAMGRKEALKHAKGDWVLVFDNDEVPEPGWIEELLVRALSQPKVGAVCCRVTFPDGKLQFSGGKVVPSPHRQSDDYPVIDLALHDRGADFTELESCRFREVDWSPIGATLFTVNIAKYLHDGYPNCFEDAGVSYALKREGYTLLNAPGALVWHDHITFQAPDPALKNYMKDRYNPKMMLRSVASFFEENGMMIYDEYIWRENGLNSKPLPEVVELLKDAKAGQMAF